MKKFLTILLLSAMALTLVACATVSAAENIEVEMTTPEPDLSTRQVTTAIETTAAETTAEPEIILEGTDAIAAQIEDDMTYADVCEVLGFEGTKIDIGEVYEWNYENGDSILVSFQYYKLLVCVEHDGENNGDPFRTAAKLTAGMTYVEICEILGVEGVDVGSGFLIYHFEVSDEIGISIRMDIKDSRENDVAAEIGAFSIK